MRIIFLLLGCCLLASCGTTPLIPSSSHLKPEAAPSGNIPQTVKQSAVLPPPQPTPRAETYSVVVDAVPVRELLFALARDAKINVDVHPGIEGTVTLNALNQTLPQLLNRIAKQVEMRYEVEDKVLTVMPDTPYLKQYRIDYLNMSRDATSNVSIATQIASSGTGNVSGSGGGGGGAAMSNNSTTSVTNKSNNRFWDTLIQNVRDILRETDKLLPDGSSITTTEQTGVQSTTGTGSAPAAGRSNARASAPANLAGSPNAASLATDNATTTQRTTFREAASVIANPENGILAVRATSRQHEKIQEFIDQVMSSAKRQVLIEATVLEVQLSDQYQQGINWTSLRSYATTSQGQVGSTNLPSGISTTATGTYSSSGVTPGATGTSPGIFLLSYANPKSILGNMAATIQLLESFGKVKVLSSPKISVLNNQTALLKVVDNRVYFTITATITPATATTAPITTYTSDLHTVPVGFVMSVTPQVSSSDEVTLNVRPTISRIIGYVQDPNPALTTATVPVVSNIPVIQAREMESILKVASGQVAVMGGLMQDSINNLKDGVPGLSQLPVVGDLFSYHNDTSTKTELVIFMRPVVIKEASMNADYKDFREFMPEQDFFTKPGPGDKLSFPSSQVGQAGIGGLPPKTATP
jgi:general secretion pathway protein D